MDNMLPMYTLIGWIIIGIGAAAIMRAAFPMKGSFIALAALSITAAGISGIVCVAFLHTNPPQIAYFASIVFAAVCSGGLLLRLRTPSAEDK